MNTNTAEMHASFKEGMQEGIEICRQMLCQSLGKDIDSFGKAVAHIDMMIINMKGDNNE